MIRFSLCSASKFFVCSALLLLSVNPAKALKPTPQALTEADKQAINQVMKDTREAFDVPGIALGIVKDGQLIYTHGSGLREMEGSKPVTADTLFSIASNTKAFTGTSLAMLADEGKLNFNDRVIDHLPWFRMSDPYITADMRIIDLLAHRSGLSLGAGDLLYWPGSTYSSEEVAKRLKDVPVTGAFRKQYAYDNILYGVAQLVIEEVSGQTYESFLQQRIFNTIDMKHTRFNADHIKPQDVVATGYVKPNFTGSLNEMVPAPRMTWHNVSGAGGIYSSVNDMAKWMVVQLAHGALDGQDDSPKTADGKDTEKRLFSPRNQAQLWNVLTPIPVRTPSTEALKPMKPNFVGYGGGFVLSDYQGERMVWHTGGWPGMVSRMTLVPDQNLGVVVLTNAESGAAFNAVTLSVLDIILKNKKHNWVGAFQEAGKKSVDRAAKSWEAHKKKRAKRSKPSLPLAGYTGTYNDPWYGDILIGKQGKQLTMQFKPSPLLKGTLEHWHHNTFIVRWEQRWLNGDAFVTFDLNHDGEVEEAHIDAVSPKTDFSFDFQDLRLKKVVGE